jgi:hypothetical protein
VFISDKQALPERPGGSNPLILRGLFRVIDYEHLDLPLEIDLVFDPRLSAFISG